MNTCDFSPDRKYRYTLVKSVNGNTAGPICAFNGLNPSTAAEDQDDPTIRRCLGYARDWGYEILVMLNLFALRSTDPKKLYWHWHDPIGPENDDFIIRHAVKADLFVACWGSHGKLHQRGTYVRNMLEARGVKLHHLGLTADGQPKHPLYLPANIGPKEWTLAEGGSNL